MSPPVYTEYFPFFSKVYDDICHLGRHKNLILSFFKNSFLYWNRSIVGETISQESIVSCWSLRVVI